MTEIFQGILMLNDADRCPMAFSKASSCQISKHLDAFTDLIRNLSSTLGS